VKDELQNLMGHSLLAVVVPREHFPHAGSDRRGIWTQQCDSLHCNYLFRRNFAKAQLTPLGRVIVNRNNLLMGEVHDVEFTSMPCNGVEGKRF
jgi:hypothetical protein